MLDVGSSTSSNKISHASNSTSTTRPMTQAPPITPTNEKRRNYRFCSGDPAIHPAEKRSYANGDYEGTPLHLSGCSDPRDGTRSDRAYYDLPIPQFKLDRSWVGAIPAKEVTFRNLNDNITKTLLTDMCKRFGEIDDCKIYFDRHTKKHLGLGTVIFKTTKAARECVKALHMTTNMGSVISVSLETAGQERTKQYASITRGQEQDKAAQEKALAASAAASPPPPSENIVGKQPERLATLIPTPVAPVTHKMTSNYSQPPVPYLSQNIYRPSATSSTMAHQSTRYDSKGHHVLHDDTEQFSFDPYASFGNSNNYKSSSSRRSHYRHQYHRQPSQQQQQRSKRRRASSSSTSSSNSRSSSSSSSSTSSSSSRSHSSTSSSSRSSYSSTKSNSKKSNSGIDSRNVTNAIPTSKQHVDDDDERPSLDARIAAIFRQQQQQTTSSPSSSSKTHHRPLPLPSGPPPSLFSFPPPPIPTPITAGGHHHHQQSYGVVNNFNFFGNSFPPASFLNPTGGTNWQDMFKQPPPSNNQSHHHHHPTKYPSTGGLQPHPNDGSDERERKTNDLTAAVSNIVTGELVELLRKDLAKKLIETLVYKSIETWYDNEERKDKIRKIKLAETSTITNEQPQSEQLTTLSSYQLQHSTSNPLFERIPDESTSPSTSAPPPFVAPSSSSITSIRMGDSLSAYFEQMKDTGGQSVRSQMPKIPTFKKRTVPEEKPSAPPTPTTPPLPASSTNEKKRQRPHSRKKFQKRVSSSSSQSSVSSDNDDSQSRESLVALDDGPTRTSEVTTSKVAIDLLSTTATTEEEEGEIKDEEDTTEGSHPAETLPPPPPPPVSSELSKPMKKSTTKQTPTMKPNKKPVPAKKRKIEQVKTEPTPEEDDLTLAKRKKSATNLHQPSVQVSGSNISEDIKLMDSQSIQTFNLLDDLPKQQPQPKAHNLFDYIRFEHDYAIVAKQPVPVATRLTVNGLHDMGIYPPSPSIPLPVPPPVVVIPTPKFPSRGHETEMRIMYELDNGVDEEDMSYLKQSFHMLSNERHSCTIKTRWVDHPASRDSPFVKQLFEKHRTGCARTEGFYKLANEEKVRRLKGPDDPQTPSAIPQVVLDTSRTSGSQISRGLRSEHRRNLAALGDVEFADHFKFSQLKLRKKRLRYAKSEIHAWGLFACEPIAMEDMVIEYVGETIRQAVGDLREKQYELEGIDSNYMFRIDSDTIVDATKCGNLARFINHSCDPNCYAKIIPVESQKKIVIYSKRDIRLGEEITYDYKFPLEDQKIPCRCRASTCRGSLN